jgi:hypothetical protein
MTREGVKTNPFGRLLRQYYVAKPAVAVAV